MNQTNWLPGIIVFAIGAVTALAYLFSSKKLKTDAPAPETLDDFDARYNSLLEQLKELMANQHLLAADAFAAEKTRLEQAAADVLRARAGKASAVTRQQARAEKLATAEPTFFSKHPALMGGLIGGGVVAFFAVLGFQLSKETVEKPDMPQQQRPGPMRSQQSDGKLEALAARVQQSPDDIDAVTDLFIHLIRRQAFQEARPLVQRAMLLDPFNPKARVGQAVVRALEGDLRGAIDDLEHLTARYPEAYDGFMFAGMLSLEDNDEPRALKNLAQYVELAPPTEQPPMMRVAVQQLREQLANPQKP